jgi:TonB-linked SusC/RagA family outer membrane protein
MKLQLQLQIPKRKIKILFFLFYLLGVGSISISANTSNTSNEVALEQERYLSKILDEIGEKYQVFFNYESSLISNIKLDFKLTEEESLSQAVKRLMIQTNLKYEVTNEKFVIIYKNDNRGKKKMRKVKRKIRQLNKLEKKGEIKIQRSNSNPINHSLNILEGVTEFDEIEKTISGKITDDQGEVLIGVTVLAKGTSTGTSTDENGNFSLSVPDDVTVLVFSYTGFQPQEIVIGGQAVIDVVMSAGSSFLNEVVVTGYGRQDKRDITGSVSTLSASQIKDIPVTSFENAIQGQLAGVQVTETSGEPGAGPSIRVRGVGSITAGNEPLYVIDGFPVSKNVDLGVQGDNFRRGAGRFRPPTQNPLATLNPNDIESIQVLKDASSASIYGSRGSNGVIVITTKKGSRKGAPVVSYDTYVGSQSVANKLDLMSSSEFIDYNIEATNNAYLQANPGASASDPNSVRTNAAWRIADDMQNPDGTDTDWQDEMFNTALLQSHNVSVAGGSEKIGYYVAANYFNQDGIIEGTDFNRYSIRMNLEADVSDKLRIGLNLSPSYTTSNKKPAGSPYFSRPPGIVYSGIVHSPTVRPFNADGTPNQLDNQSYLNTSDGEVASLSSASNPFAIIEGIDDQLTQFRTMTNLYAEYDIMKNLTFKTFVGIDINNYKRNFFRKNSLLYRTSASGESYGQSSSSESVSWLSEQTLSYNTTINDKHKINAVAGYTAQKEAIDINTIIADNFADDLVPTVSGGQVVQGTAVQEEWSLVSMLARVNYDFDDRLLVTASIRSDKSSRFGAGNKTGIFPSASIGYRISKHVQADWLSDLKLRASWGRTGNFLIPNYASIGLLAPANTTFGGSLVNGIGASTISNKDLSWEKTSSYDIGLDFGFLKDRIYGSLEYFNATTTDLLLAVQVPSALGFTNALTNIGEVVNKGFEVSVTSRNTTGKLKWQTNLNFSTVDNEVTKLGPSGDPILSSGGAGNRHITQIGDPIGSYYGYMTDGIYQNQTEIDAGPVDQIATPRPGDFKWVDVNNDGFINAEDRTVVGNYLPDYTFGITNIFTYENISFSFLIQGVQGNEVLNLTRRHMGNGEANYNSYRDWNDRWQSESNPGNGEIPRANRQTGNSNNRPSNFQVEDASYIRLRNVTIAYTFPKSSLGNTFSGVRVSLSGTNLYTWTNYLGYNPEVNNNEDNVNVQGEDYGAYPLARIFTLGLNASF